MNKKALGIFLMGALSLCCSCIDDTYDVLNKEISTDMQIKGNKLSLPLGSLCPIPLDSLLVDSLLDSIPILKVDKETRTYSLSFNDSIKTGVDKGNLEALKKVSALSADIDPISIPIKEISFDPEAYSFSKELEFGEVDLTDITLNEIKPDPITLELDELTLEPIKIDVKPEDPIKFNIPQVELKPIEIAEVSQTATFNIDDINLEEGTTINIETQKIELDVPEFNMPEITPPSFSAYYNVPLSAPAIDEAIKLFPTSIPVDLGPIPVNIDKTDEHEVAINFGYKLPKDITQIEDLTKIVFDKDSSKVNFKLKNPAILRSQTDLNREIIFTIEFPGNYKLAIDEEADPNKYKYEWNPSTPNILSATIVPGDEEVTEISLYVTEIGLDFDSTKEEIAINDKATCELSYVVNGNVFLKKGTTITEIKEGLKYNLGLDVAFTMAEVWGSTNPVTTEKSVNQELDFSFELNNLDYIESIDKITLDQEKSKLSFSMGINNGFGAFDIDDNSKIVLSLPEEFIFAEEGMVLPKDSETGEALVVYNKKANEFEISSLKIFESNEPWILPISGVDFKGQGVVTDGTFSFSKKAVVKAVTGTEDILTIGGVDNIDLVGQTKILFQDHEITLNASPITLVVTDVQGSTAPIGLEFIDKTFEFNFDLNGKLDNISSINYVKFDTDVPITITSSVQGFDGIEFEEGSQIALHFPEEFIFDTVKCSLDYIEDLQAFVIDDFSELTNGTWTFALQEVKFAPQTDEVGFNIAAKVTMKAINDKGTSNTLYVGFADNFSLDKMRKQGLFGEKNLSVELKKAEIVIEDVQVATKEINVDFKKLEVTYPINIDNLSYITKIGSIDLDEANNSLNFHSEIKGEDDQKKELGRFDLAENSVIDLKFPEKFKLDITGSHLPDEAEFIDSSTIKIKSLSALDSKDWELKVKRIAIDTEISGYEFEDEYTISVVGYDANSQEGALTIAAIKDLTFQEIQSLGGECNMDISVNGEFEIADVEVSIEDIGVEFKGDTYETPIPTIENLELVKSIEYISFEEGKNIISLNILLDGDLGDFDLVDSEVKLSIPSAFVLDDEKCNFSDFNGGLEYRQEESAIYIKSIQSIINHPIQLAIKQININQPIVDNKFDWDVNFAVAAVDKNNIPTDKLYVGCKDNNLRFTEVSPIMGNKTIQILVEKATLSIEEAVIVSNGITESINEKVEIPLKETITEAIDRVDSIGFKESVPMTLIISTKGLESLDVPVNIFADITFPPVFDITSDDNNITVTEQGLRIDTAYSFKEDLKLQLSVHNLDFTSLEGGCLTLTPDGNGGRILEYNDSAAIKGSISIAEANISSKLLEGVSMDLSFDMDEVILKDFTGLYSGTIDPIKQSFELGIENGFDDLKENGITLTNTKPELMISIYNPIGVPVDVDLSIVGKDKDGNEIPTSKIAPQETLRIEPAKFNEQGELVADTTRWFFTSNEKAEIPTGYTPVVIENLASLLDELPYSIDFSLAPSIVTKDVKHHVDLTRLELGGSYAISVPFDLKFEQSVPLEFGEEVDEILRDMNNTLALANPQLALAIHNPIADSLVFDLSIIGKDANGQPIETFKIDFSDDPFVLKAGVRKEDGTITPTATRWLFAVSEDIQREGYETKVAPALGTLLANIPHDIDIALNAHFNTNLTQQIDYDNDLELTCEYGISLPLQFDEIHLSYADTISEIQLNLQESLEEMNVSISNVGLGIKMNLKNTLPLGLKLNLIPLDAQSKPIQGIKIESIEIPAGKGQAIAEEEIEGTPVELSIQCDSPNTLSALDKIAFSIEVEAGNGDHALSGKQGLQVCDIVLEVKCDAEINLGK